MNATELAYQIAQAASAEAAAIAAAEAARAAAVAAANSAAAARNSALMNSTASIAGAVVGGLYTNEEPVSLVAKTMAVRVGRASAAQLESAPFVGATPYGSSTPGWHRPLC